MGIWCAMFIEIIKNLERSSLSILCNSRWMRVQYVGCVTMTTFEHCREKNLYDSMLLNQFGFETFNHNKHWTNDQIRYRSGPLTPQPIRSIHYHLETNWQIHTHTTHLRTLSIIYYIINITKCLWRVFVTWSRTIANEWTEWTNIVTTVEKRANMTQKGNIESEVCACACVYVVRL